MSRMRSSSRRTKSQSSTRGDKGDTDGGIGLEFIIFSSNNGSQAQVARTEFDDHGEILGWHY